MVQGVGPRPTVLCAFLGFVLTAVQLIDEGRAWLRIHYPGYDKFNARERRILAAAWECDVLRPTERTGHNDGEAVEAIQSVAGGHRGDPWCAFAQVLIAMIAGVWHPSSGGGAVIAWKIAARKSGRLIESRKAVRGDLLIRDRGDGKRHIGVALSTFVLVGKIGWVKSIEGNTSPSDEGSQRDGQGTYRRRRLLSFWDNAVRGD